MKFVRINPRALLNRDWCNFSFEFKALVKRVIPQSLKLRVLFDDFTMLYAKVEEYMEQLPTNSVSEHIIHADSKRHEAFQSIADEVRRNLDNPQAEVRRAAKRIQTLAKKCSAVVLEPYEVEFRFLVEFKKDIQKKHMLDVVLLGVDGYIQELLHCQDDFETLLRACHEEGVSCICIELLDARRKANTCYFEMLDLIEKLISAGGEEPFRSFVENQNILVKEYLGKQLWN